MSKQSHWYSNVHYILTRSTLLTASPLFFSSTSSGLSRGRSLSVSSSQCCRRLQTCCDCSRCLCSYQKAIPSSYRWNGRCSGKSLSRVYINHKDTLFRYLWTKISSWSLVDSLYSRRYSAAVFSRNLTFLPFVAPSGSNSTYRRRDIHHHFCSDDG